MFYSVYLERILIPFWLPLLCLLGVFLFLGLSFSFIKKNYWRMVALQWCVIFCTTKCISCMYTHNPPSWSQGSVRKDSRQKLQGLLRPSFRSHAEFHRILLVKTSHPNSRPFLWWEEWWSCIVKGRVIRNKKNCCSHLYKRKKIYDWGREK